MSRSVLLRQTPLFANLCFIRDSKLVLLKTFKYTLSMTYKSIQNPLLIYSLIVIDHINRVYNIHKKITNILACLHTVN